MLRTGDGCTVCENSYAWRVVTMNSGKIRMRLSEHIANAITALG